MDKIPTAEEFFKDETHPSQVKRLSDRAIEFTKLHVKAALQAAAENAKIIEEWNGEVDNDRIDYKPVIDDFSILNSYPEENIK